MRLPRAWFAAVAVAAATCPAAAQEQVTIDLTGVQIRNASNQSRDSSPNTISPAFGYRYVIDGYVRGVGGVLGLLYPNPTPLAQVMEDLAPGSSSGLEGEGYNPGGAHPVVLVNDRTEGVTVIGGVTVTYGLTLIAGIRADHVAYFQIFDVILSPSFLVGYLQFTSGSVTIMRIPVVPGDLNWDGRINGEDVQALALGLADSAAYRAAYGENPLLAGDLNRDGLLDSADADALAAVLLAG